MSVEEVTYHQVLRVSPNHRVKLQADPLPRLHAECQAGILEYYN